MINKNFTLKDAREVFAKLAADERIPHALTDGCDARRELMIGLMLSEMAVPKENIGRILVLPKLSSRERITSVRPETLLNDKLYMNDTRVDAHISAKPPNFPTDLKPHASYMKHMQETMQWGFHTAVTVKFYDPSLDKQVEMVIDPHINPTRMLTVSEFTDDLARRARGAEMEIEHKALGESSPVMGMRLFGGIIDWGTNDVKQVTKNMVDEMESCASQLRKEGLLGKAYVKKWEDMHDYAVRGL